MQTSEFGKFSIGAADGWWFDNCGEWAVTVLFDEAVEGLTGEVCDENIPKLDCYISEALSTEPIGIFWLQQMAIKIIVASGLLRRCKVLCHSGFFSFAINGEFSTLDRIISLAFSWQMQI